MADEEKTTIEISEKDEADQSAPKKKSNLVLFAIIGVVCIVLGVGGGMYFSGSAGSEDDIASQDEPEQKKEKHAEKQKPKKKKKSSGGHGETEGSIVYALKDIVVNPAGTGGSRFLSVSFGFELEDEDLEAVFKDREPLVRDALITILSSKTVSQLTDIKQKEIMRYQVKRRLSKLLETEGLTGVYFTDFVLQ